MARPRLPRHHLDHPAAADPLAGQRPGQSQGTQALLRPAGRGTDPHLRHGSPTPGPDCQAAQDKQPAERERHQDRPQSRHRRREDPDHGHADFVAGQQPSGQPEGPPLRRPISLADTRAYSERKTGSRPAPQRRDQRLPGVRPLTARRAIRPGVAPSPNHSRQRAAAGPLAHQGHAHRPDQEFNPRPGAGQPSQRQPPGPRDAPRDAPPSDRRQVPPPGPHHGHQRRGASLPPGRHSQNRQHADPLVPRHQAPGRSQKAELRGRPLRHAHPHGPGNGT